MGRTTADTVFEHSPWAFRHFVLGTVAIFVYVGVEVRNPWNSEFLYLRPIRQRVPDLSAMPPLSVVSLLVHIGY